MKTNILEVNDKTILLNHIPAFEALAIRRDYLEFIKQSKDSDFCKSYILRVLKHASLVMGKDNMVPLSTEAFIDQQLGSWKNLETVFRAILEYNEMNVEEMNRDENYWQRAGGEMATAFAASLHEIMTPFLKASLSVENERSE